MIYAIGKFTPIIPREMTMVVERHEERLGAAKFDNCAAPLMAKDMEDQRRLCACYLIRQMIWPFLTEPESREAVEVTEQYVQGKVDKRVFFKAKQAAKKALRRLPNFGPDHYKKSAAVIVTHVTWSPFGQTTFCSAVVDGIAWNIAEQKAAPALCDRAIPENHCVVDKAHGEMADHVLIFLKKEPSSAKAVKSLLDDPLLCKYHFRYFNPYATKEFVSMNVQEKTRRTALLNALDCFFEVAPRSTFSAADLAPIAILSQSLLRRDREAGVLLLLALGMHHPAAREALIDLMDSAKAAIRFTTISFFGFYHLPLPGEFVVRTVGKGLQDVSSKVRLFASQAAANYFEIKETVPLLEHKLENETNEKVRTELEYDLPRLRDGYRIEERSDGKFEVSVKTKRGIEFIELSKKDLEPTRFKRIIEGIRSEGVASRGGILGFDAGIEP